MKYSKVPVSDKKYLNYIFIESAIDGKVVTTMFDTRGNTLIKKSIADQINVSYIDNKPIDEKRGWRRARVDMRIGGLEIGSAPVIIANDDSFDLMQDPQGNKFPADMILGWNIISQLCFRGDLRKGDFEVQIDDFRKSKSKDQQNAPVLYIEFEGEKILAALNSSLPVTNVSQEIFDKIVDKKDTKKTIEMLGLNESENLSYETTLRFKIDQDEISLKGAQLNPHLNNKDVQIIFGADLLWSTTWAIYSPMRYIRAKQ
ncbi:MULTISPECIES: hypothetical protein [Anaerococcus]|uniref:hypothetical protein n=1 Tax=Anaerococcus TaxID=165779 RepID=UPI001AE445B6|nr:MULTISPECIES: hypothetical protein [Anaerococcus]MBP2068944.1 hypothetical protein [Anaerococcus nagyae]MDU2566081.1 hypothetical protein [Anaerococcus sp.]MDU3212104.1 hypothetical protein [Anaerococcus sp.]